MWAPRFGLFVLMLAGALVAQDAAPLPAAPSSSSRDAAAQELPAAPSATQLQLSQERFRAQVDAPPELPRRLTAGDKFQLFMQHTNSPFTFTAAGVAAGVGQAANTDPGFGQGWRGFRSRYGAALADTESHAFFSKFLIPVLAHQDPRYKRNGREPFAARVLDALSQIVETDDDEGEPQFNYSQVLGTAVSASISNVYYPPSSRGFRRTGYRAVTRLGTEAGMNVVREFLPDLKRAIFGRPKVSEREREALSWRTGTQPSVTPER
jgi:hypothetical protein